MPDPKNATSGFVEAGRLTHSIELRPRESTDLDASRSPIAGSAAATLTRRCTLRPLAGREVDEDSQQVGMQDYEVECSYCPATTDMVATVREQYASASFEAQVLAVAHLGSRKTRIRIRADDD